MLPSITLHTPNPRRPPDATLSKIQTQPVPHPNCHHPFYTPCLASSSHRPLLLLSSQGCVARSRSNGHEKKKRVLISGQFGKAWAPTLGLWGVGAGTAALFVRCTSQSNLCYSHRCAVFLITLCLGISGRKYSSFP